MASPPRSSPTSPPYPQHAPLPNPKKRPSIQLSTSQHPAKRRKPGSIASGASSAHPLRQTSFPPSEVANGQRSPSVDTDVTGFTGDGARSVKGKKRKGKRKKRDTNESIAGKSRTAAAEGSVAADADEEDEDEDEGAEGNYDDEGTGDDAAEKERRAVLFDAFNHDQTDRYSRFFNLHLRHETTRRIVNFTLAQSVPQNLVKAIDGYTKVFIGTLIERARDVQEEWAALQTPPNTPQQSSNVMKGESSPANGDADAGADDTRLFDGNLPNDSTQSTLKEQKERYLGPLLPDHLREALRRYRRDGEVQATGLTGFSVGLGMPGTGSARLQGRRLFR